MNIRCPDTTKCNECSCGRTPEDRQSNILSLDQLSAGGFEEAEEDIERAAKLACLEFEEIVLCPAAGERM